MPQRNLRRQKWTYTDAIQEAFLKIDEKSVMDRRIQTEEARNQTPVEDRPS